MVAGQPLNKKGPESGLQDHLLCSGRISDLDGRIDCPFPDVLGQGDRVTRRISRWVLAIAYLTAGILHLSMPTVFQQIAPGWVPFPRLVIIGTGFCEILGAAGLVTQRFRHAAGIGLALYAVCVFPANIKHAVDDLSGGDPALGWWYHVPRLALQPFLVWWALAAGDTVQGPLAHILRCRSGTPRSGDEEPQRP